MSLKTIVVITMCYVGLVYGQSSSCQTPDGNSGECVSIPECSSYLNLLNKPDKTNQDYIVLSNSHCGSGSVAKVCCPKQETEPVYSINGPCITPDGDPGKCISLYSCPQLRNMLRGTIPTETLALVLKSKCMSPEPYSVCCALPRPINEEPGNCQTKMTAFPPDPSSQCCGEESSLGNKIVGANQTGTAIDEYPWMVVIEYLSLKYRVTSLLCAGSLISGKYVLTAAHCVTGKILATATPTGVRLGEYDTSHEGMDCVITQSGGEDCTDGVTRIAIEKSTPHPKYDSTTKENDIALIRLKETAPYTDFIRPVCLPAIDLTLPENTPPFFSMYAVGWGKTETGRPSNIKLQINVPFVSLDECQQIYNVPGLIATLRRSQLCAGGIEGIDSCKGDSGGPLVYQKENGLFEAIGIVSFGPMGCGTKGTPGIYTNVYTYLDWIKSVIVS